MPSRCAAAMHFESYAIAIEGRDNAAFVHSGLAELRLAGLPVL